jgi:hypothetical protein
MVFLQKAFVLEHPRKANRGGFHGTARCIGNDRANVSVERFDPSDNNDFQGGSKSCGATPRPDRSSQMKHFASHNAKCSNFSRRCQALFPAQPLEGLFHLRGGVI